MSKIIDTITFFDNNFIFDFRFNILEKYVDKFVVCESTYDHKGIKKEINLDISDENLSLIGKLGIKEHDKSRRGTLGLDLESLKAIRNYFKKTSTLVAPEMIMLSLASRIATSTATATRLPVSTTRSET